MISCVEVDGALIALKPCTVYLIVTWLFLAAGHPFLVSSLLPFLSSSDTLSLLLYLCLSIFSLFVPLFASTFQWPFTLHFLLQVTKISKSFYSDHCSITQLLCLPENQRKKQRRAFGSCAPAVPILWQLCEHSRLTYPEIA